MSDDKRTARPKTRGQLLQKRGTFARRAEKDNVVCSGVSGKEVAAATHRDARRAADARPPPCSYNQSALWLIVRHCALGRKKAMPYRGAQALARHWRSLLRPVRPSLSCSCSTGTDPPPHTTLSLSCIYSPFTHEKKGEGERGNIITTAAPPLREKPCAPRAQRPAEAHLLRFAE